MELTIREAREIINLSQKDFGDLLGLTQASVSRLERRPITELYYNQVLNIMEILNLDNDRFELKGEKLTCLQ